MTRPDSPSAARRTLHAFITVLLAALFAGCAETASTPAGARATATPSPAATTAASAGATSDSAKPRRKRSRRAKPRATPRSAPTREIVACDPNISVRATTTSCPFAQNVFYAFYMEAISFKSQNAIQAYSPVSGVDYAVACATDDADNVTCVAGDGGEVHFNLSALQAYDDDQAAAYADTHDLGPSAGGDSASDSGGDPDTSLLDSSSGYSDEDLYGAEDDLYGDGEAPLDDRIPNYDNGNGYPVQCADGMWSQSGGIQGACSGHGGVG